jgi:hypothetical protein
VDEDSALLELPINPTPRPCLRATWVTWEAVKVLEWTTCRGLHDRCWLTGLWSTEAKVEGIVLKAAWHWGSDSSVLNDPLVEQDRTPFYFGLPSAWGSVEGDRMWALETERLSL